MDKRCWNCEHAKEIECDESIKQYMNDFIHCDKDEDGIKCNKMYNCHQHKFNNNITITEPSDKLKAKWKNFQFKEDKND